MGNFAQMYGLCTYIDPMKINQTINYINLPRYLDFEMASYSLSNEKTLLFRVYRVIILSIYVGIVLSHQIRISIKQPV